MVDDFEENREPGKKPNTILLFTLSVWKAVVQVEPLLCPTANRK